MAGLTDLVAGAVSGIASMVTTFFTRRAEIAAQNHANDLAAAKASGDRRAQLLSQGLTADATWETESIRAAGWGRNFELIVVSIPLVLCFFKAGSDIVSAGFKSLSTTPQWYQWMVMAIYMANYGIRLWRRTQSDT
jgi:hypothetical protein